jgi:hypothetical protein
MPFALRILSSSLGSEFGHGWHYVMDFEANDMSIDDWNLADINTGKELDTIFPLSARAQSLLVRNRAKPLLKEYRFVAALGAIDILEGLEYHHDNIIRISDALARGDTVPETSINHEATGYINRLGQFYYFAKSDLVLTAVVNFATAIPTICKFIVFRNKTTAHRSIDAPKRMIPKIRRSLTQGRYRR